MRRRLEAFFFSGTTWFPKRKSGSQTVMLASTSSCSARQVRARLSCYWGSPPTPSHGGLASFSVTERVTCPFLPKSMLWRACRSEEHTSELQSLMRISYAVFCLKKKKQQMHHTQVEIVHHNRAHL